MRRFGTGLAGLFLVVCVPTSAGAQTPDRAAAAARIEQYIAIVDARSATMAERYHGTAAVAALEGAMDEAGVDWAARYAPEWGGNVCLKWNAAERFYARHRQALEESLDAVRRGDPLDRDDLDYLDRGMQAFLERDAELRRLFSDYVDALARNARELDKEHAGQSTKRKPYLTTIQQTVQQIETIGSLAWVFSALDAEHRLPVPSSAAAVAGGSAGPPPAGPAATAPR